MQYQWMSMDKIEYMASPEYVYLEIQIYCPAIQLNKNINSIMCIIWFIYATVNNMFFYIIAILRPKTYKSESE